MSRKFTLFGEASKLLYTEQEAATLLCMSPRMLADRRRAGKISHIKDGHCIAYMHEHLEAYVRSQADRYPRVTAGQDGSFTVTVKGRQARTLANTLLRSATGLKKEE